MIVSNGRNILEIANAQLRYKNFSGQEKQAMVGGKMRTVNDKGNRNFNVVLDPEKSDIWWNGEKVIDPDFGQQLSELGYNVTVRPPKEEGDAPEYRLPVSVSYGSAIKPKLYLVTDRTKVEMTEDMLPTLDMADIIKADLVINNGRPYMSQTKGREMVKAWCNEGYFTIAKSRFADSYDFIDDEES